MRTFDNSTVCTLPKHIKVLVNADGGSYTLSGMVDTRRRKYYPWTTTNLLHLCPKSINLTAQDFAADGIDYEASFDGTPWEILG